MAVWNNTTDCEYVAATQFKVTGNLISQFPETIRVRVKCSGEWIYASVSSASYDGAETTVTLVESTLTSPCTEVEDGGVVSGDQGNIPAHPHEDSSTGGSNVVGTAPAHEISGTQIRFRNPDGSWGDWCTVSVPLPQDLYTDSNPTFAGLTLSGLTGILMANGASPLSVKAATAALQVLRRNAGNTDYEFAAQDPSNVIQFTGTAGEALDQYKVCYADQTDSGEYKVASSEGITLVNRESLWPQAIVTQEGGISNGSTGTFLSAGIITNAGWSLTPGANVYCGEFGDVEDTAGTESIRLGFALTANTIFFAPDSFLNFSNIDWELIYQTYFCETGVAGENLSYGDLVYSDPADSGKWKKAQSDGTSTEAEVAGVAYDDYLQNAECIISLFGVAFVNGGPFSVGAKLYLSETPGQATASAPANPIVIGYALGNTYGDWVSLQFRPEVSGAGTPASTVTDETSWGVTPATGTATNYAREDHTHGTPAEPSSGGGPAPDYTPPSMKWKDADEVTLTPNRYHKAGWRLDGQYQDLTNMASYWDLAAAVDVDVDAAGTMIGGDVVSSWYSLFMTAADTFLVLPFIRVDAIAYSAPNTVINPADHADGTTANNNFVSANDVFNTYRLMLLSDTAYHGTIYTIADSVDGTPDQILITGDKTAEIAATEWLQMIPPSGTACLYLGPIRFHSDGSLRWFKKDKWFYQLPDRTMVNGVANLTPDNTDLGAAIPPTATKFLAGCRIESTNASSVGLTCNIYRGIAGSDITEQILPMANLAAHIMLSSIVQLFPLSAICKIRNSFQMNTGSWVAATSGQFMITAFEE